jgi:hypothetical protein
MYSICSARGKWNLDGQEEDMESLEVKKVCRSCGTNVAHKKRHKHRDGTYTCPDCQKTQDHSPKKIVEGLKSKKFMLYILWVIIALAACRIFWKVLEYVNQPGPN